MRTYTHTYIRTYIRTYMHTYIHTYTYTYVHIYIDILVMKVQNLRGHFLMEEPASKTLEQPMNPKIQGRFQYMSLNKRLLK